MAKAIAMVPTTCDAQTSEGCATGFCALARGLPREVARDDEPLDLARPLVDLRDARVAVVSLDRIVAKVAIAAMDLDRLGTHPLGELRGVELGLRCFGEARLAGAAHARCVKDQQARGVDARMHVGEVISDGRVLDQLLAELR